MAEAAAEKQVAALYAAPAGEFVQRRDALAKKLRERGDREAAAHVKALRRPTAAAWAVNQLALHEKMRLRRLFTAGERLRAAHAQALAGGHMPALVAARADEQAAIEELARAARALLEERGQAAGDALLDKVRDTLHAAVVDPELGERVRAGRLEQEERATGFSLPAGAPKPKPGKAPGAEKRKAEEDRKRKRREAQERVRAARREADAARRAVDLAAEDLRRAEAALVEAERQLDAIS